MNDLSERTIQYLSARSTAAVVVITGLIAISGGLLSAFRVTSLSVIWIPLCFLVIPAAHFLSRELLLQRKRIAELEKRLAER
jgi:hypothetical protein